jgi:hypothetical protein
MSRLDAVARHAFCSCHTADTIECVHMCFLFFVLVVFVSIINHACDLRHGSNAREQGEEEEASDKKRRRDTKAEGSDVDA